MTMSGPSPALRSLAHHCRTALTGGIVDEKKATEALRVLAQRHRVAGLYGAAVGDSASVERVVSASLRQVAECAALSARLSDVHPLILKGLPLAVLGYADPLLKQAADIDLLVEESSIDVAGSLLRDAGYQQRVPSQRAALSRWHKISNQSVWTRNEIAVELHARPLIVPFTPTQPHQDVAIAPGIVIRTFGDQDLYPYLVLHGGLSGWFRLKWLVDLYAFLMKRSGRVEEFHAIADERGAGVASSAALQLLHALFDLPIPKAALDNRDAERLAIVSLGLLESGEPTLTLGGRMAIHRAYFMVSPGLRSITRRTSELIGQRLLR